MAAVYVTEYSQMATVGQANTNALMNLGNSTGQGQAAQVPPVAEQVVSITGSTTQSASFNASTKFIRINTDAICSIAFGPNPTATATSQRFAANQTEYFGIAPGDKLAVITNV